MMRRSSSRKADAAAEDEEPLLSLANPEKPASPAHGEEGLVFEATGQSRHGRSRRATARYSPEPEPTSRRRKRQQPSAAEEDEPQPKSGGNRRSRTAEEENEAGSEEAPPADGDEDIVVGEEEVDPEEDEAMAEMTEEQRHGRRKRGSGGGGPAKGGRGRGGSSKGGRGRDQTAATTPAASRRKSGKLREGDGEGTNDSKQAAPEEPKEQPVARQEPEHTWERAEDREWAKDIGELRAAFAEFCQREEEAKQLRDQIHRLLQSWEDKPTPSAEVLQKTKAGKLLKNRVLKHAQNSTLLNIRYPRAVFNKWRGDFVAEKEPRPVQQQQHVSEERVGGQSEPAAVKSEMRENGMQPGAREAKEESAAETSRPTGGVTAVRAASVAKSEPSASAPGPETAVVRMLADKATALEARCRPPPKQDEARDKGVAILMHSLQPPQLPGRVAVVLEELIFRSRGEKSGNVGAEYRRELHRMWNHLSRKGDAHNPAVREALLEGNLSPELAAAMSSEALSAFPDEPAFGEASKIVPGDNEQTQAQPAASDAGNATANVPAN